MKFKLKNSLSHGKKRILYKLKQALLVGLFFIHVSANSQIANYINNGGFESCGNCNENQTFAFPKYWSAIDSTKFFGILCSANNAPFLVPLSSYTYQWPRHGNNFLITTLFSPTCNNQTCVGYPGTKLKQALQQGNTYCFTMYVNLSNQSTHGIDALGAYFTDNSNDTIKYCTIPIEYLTPQIQNPVGNVIVDTLGWTKVSGNYLANGTEEYLLIGNFKNTANTASVLVNPANLPSSFSAYAMDDVSLIDIDLPANAGPDQWCIPGDSVFIGRQPDVGIDEACIWYKLPDMVNAIDTVAGLWVKPVVTTTYVVKQEICAGIKYDTVVVHQSATGLVSSGGVENGFDIYPNPATDAIKIVFAIDGLLSYTIKDIAGKIVQAGNLNVKQNLANLNLDLNNGVYLITITGSNGATTKKIIINK